MSGLLKRIPTPTLLFCLVFCWFILPFISSCFGPYSIAFPDMLEILTQILRGTTPSGNGEKTAYLVISQFRLSRSFLALLCGGSLAVAGAILQGVLRNPLADPFTLGISAGAACGASVVLGFSASLHFPFISQSGLASLAAFAGSMLALFATLFLGRAKGSWAKENIILAGIAVAAFLGSLVALIKALNEESVTSIVFWLMGSLQGRGWESLHFVLMTLLPALAVFLLGWRKLDLLSLGDEQARLLGLSPGWSRFWLLCVASFMTAGCVAICGIIGFVGLVVPHIMRLLLGAGHGPLLLASFFGGGIFLLLADTLARTILDGGQELPTGVITALAGGPFFAFLIWHRK